jgi:hypothetical protein
VTPTRDSSKVSAPTAPRPQGLCAGGTGCH